MININSQFDGGNIECNNCENADSICLSIRPDNHSEFYQWFYFRLTGGLDQDCTLTISNASGAAYPGGWDNYQAVASYDRDSWFRVSTEYRAGELIIRLRPEYDSVYLAYFAPYSLDRHAELIGECLQSPRAGLEIVGTSLDGRDLDLLHIGDGEADRKQYWVIARQHPGETMAQWWMEGFLDRLLDPDDPVSRELLQRVRFAVVPNMNPDGSFRGHLRTNAAGANLNREWQNPSLERSPEVYHVRQAMQRSGVDFCLDVHGDETLPYNFIAGTEGIAAWTAHRNAVLTDFKATLARLNPDFQTQHGYPPNQAGKANLTFCSNQVADRFDCPAMTLEMPFKDNANAPIPYSGWSPERARLLGSACVQALLECQASLASY